MSNDCATQTVYVYSKTDNTTRHIGNELDIIWTRFFMEGKVRRTWAPAKIRIGPMLSSGSTSSKDAEKARAG